MTGRRIVGAATATAFGIGVVSAASAVAFSQNVAIVTPTEPVESDTVEMAEPQALVDFVSQDQAPAPAVADQEISLPSDQPVVSPSEPALEPSPSIQVVPVNLPPVATPTLLTPSPVSPITQASPVTPTAPSPVTPTAPSPVTPTAPSPVTPTAPSPQTPDSPASPITPTVPSAI